MKCFDLIFEKDEKSYSQIVRIQYTINDVKEYFDPLRRSIIVLLNVISQRKSCVLHRFHQLGDWGSIKSSSM